MKPIDFSNGIARQDLEQVRQRFSLLHRERLQRISNDLLGSRKSFLELLPLYLHINHPLLPGFVSSETPCGLSKYDLDDRTIQLAKSHYRGFDYRKRGQLKYMIHGLYVMGSMGSIAYSKKSDLDFWVCHDPGMSDAELETLQLKLTRLEQHADELGLEIHFFLMNVDRFRRGETQAISKESSGSTQHGVLLEEFYRTAVLLAGRYPLWWMVPPDKESEYTRFARHLLDNRFVEEYECLDFGGLEKVPASEFFGVAHWQLYKGIDSPYKAVLKILLSEAYAHDFPKVQWLCLDIKRAVYEGHISVDDTDAYVLMYQRVEQYLRQCGEEGRIELARRCFYFKVERPLTGSGRRGRLSWQRQRLEALIADWGWDRDYLVHLDSCHRWKVNEVMAERSKLVKELSRSYRVLVDLARNYGQSTTIDPAELHLLGRKLYTALERRPGKIDLINPGISRDLSEPVLLLQYCHGNGSTDRGQWQLNLPDTHGQLLHRSLSLVEVLGWAHLNGIMIHTTRLMVDQTTIQQREIQALRDALYKLFPGNRPPATRLRALGRDAYLTSCSLFVNLGVDPFERLAKNGFHLTSTRSDPLSFGSARQCLVLTIEQLVTTSWGETICSYQEGPTGLLDTLCNYLRFTLGMVPNKAPLRVDVQSHGTVRGTTIAKRLSQLFNHAAAVFSPTGRGSNSRFLLAVESTFYLVQQQKEGYSWKSYDTVDELLDALSEPLTSFSPVVTDGEVLTDTPLPLIFKQAEAGRLQLFYYQTQNAVDLYILDKNGSLFRQRVSSSSSTYLLAHQHRFLTSLQQRLSLTSKNSTELLWREPPRYFELRKAQGCGWSCHEKIPPEIGLGEEFLDLRLIGYEGRQPNSPLVLMVGDREFDSTVHGDAMYRKVVEYLLSLRQGKDSYPIYLTGVEPSDLTQGNEWNTMQFLQQKQRIEQRLNSELRSKSRS